MPENNWKQNLNQPYTSKCKKDVTSGYDYELVYVDNKCSKLLKSHLGNDGILLIVWLTVVNTVVLWLNKI